jgi:hypothetical protein
MRLSVGSKLPYQLSLVTSLTKSELAAQYAELRECLPSQTAMRLER